MLVCLVTLELVINPYALSSLIPLLKPSMTNMNNNGNNTALSESPSDPKEIRRNPIDEDDHIC